MGLSGVCACVLLKLPLKVCTLDGSGGVEAAAHRLRSPAEVALRRGQRSIQAVKLEQSGGGSTPPRKTPLPSSHDEKKSMSSAMFE